MESDFEEPETALAALSADRERLAERYAQQPRWAVPAQALGIAAMVASPAAGVGWMSVWTAVAILGLFLVDRAVRRRTGLRVGRPAGPLGLTVLIVLIVLVVALYVVSLAISLPSAIGSGAGDGVGVAVVTAAAFLATLLGGLLYDRVYLREVRRAG